MLSIVYAGLHCNCEATILICNWWELEKFKMTYNLVLQ